MGLPKKTRSPTRRSDTATRVVAEYWARDECGRLRPAARYEYRTSPEQSNDPGPDAPQRYGEPSRVRATAAALVAVGEAGGSGARPVRTARSRDRLAPLEAPLDP